MLYRKIEKVIEDHLKSGSAKILLIEGGACGTIENSYARSASEFGNTSCPALYDSRHKEVFRQTL